MPTDRTIHEKIERARRDLLDLSMRNRLLNTPRRGLRSTRLEIVDELSSLVFRQLVDDGRKMTFLPRSEPEPGAETEAKVEVKAEGDAADALVPSSPPQLTQPEDELPPAERHTDSRLQTDRTSERLQTGLLGLYRAARTAIEEQGANLLYLALGFLKWYEAPNSDVPRFAPLLLLPVELERPSARARFRLQHNGEDITTNLSLRAKLENDFAIVLPEVGETDEFDASEYFRAVERAVDRNPRWEVLENDMVLWLFSFSKFLMYRDLGHEAWPAGRALRDHVLIQGLLDEGFASEPPLDEPGGKSLDERLDPRETMHVLDADSSQAAAIEAVRAGRNLVIQGPPGTGKSQTIANLIASAVCDGKNVLFVAEKLAALEVVKRRLDNLKLGEMCLELHSRKARKKAVLEDLKRTSELGRPRVGNVSECCDELAQNRFVLNEHAIRLHTRDPRSAMTPYEVQAELVALQADGLETETFELPEATEWDPEEFRRRENLLADLARHLEPLGDVVEHPWRGVWLETFLPADREPLRVAIAEVLECIEQLRDRGREFSRVLEQPDPATIDECSRLLKLGRLVAESPAMDRSRIGGEVWEERFEELRKIVKVGMRLTASRAALEGKVVEAAWETDVSATRRDLARFGGALFRWFRKPWRDAKAHLVSLLAGPPPANNRDRLKLLDQLVNGRRALASLSHPRIADRVGPEAFGDRWFKDQSDWEQLERIVDWVDRGRSLGLADEARALLGAIDDDGEVVAGAEEVGRLVDELAVRLGGFVGRVELDVEMAFGVGETAAIPLGRLQERLEAAQSNPESLSRWMAYHRRCRQVVSLGLADLARQVNDGEVAPGDVVPGFRYVYFNTLFRKTCREYPRLGSFSGESHGLAQSAFRDRDIERIELARQEVALAHYRRMPTGGPVGEMGVLAHEWSKKRRHLPLRKLMSRAGRATQQLKPVFMMSPPSVAQFLEPGTLDFDLLLIDEASQVRPVEALGAIARCRQIVVVGDNRQLPPTRFFQVAADVDDEIGDDEFDVEDLESILDVCSAQGMHQEMLRWHYRSRHESLIAVSNHEFYDGRLFIIPSPLAESDRYGVKFHHVADGVFDRGGTATNRVEARRVADAVIDHARRFPNSSLGVGAFSVRQRDAILDELELRWREDADVEEFFIIDGPEPFFVKNLENIQGDERDVIFISVGYGPDSDGKMSMNFGPLNADGGERRLNVLITRSRERCEVFSSITAGHIDLRRTQARGVQALKSYLQFAETGMLEVAAPTERGFDSPFEEEVYRTLTVQGHDVQAQVGTAGFFVDLAIVDPELPGRYLLGIECDGANYHSSRYARDRDRIRQAVLEDRGWLIHRIWSTDWFYRPIEEQRRLIQAIERARIEWASRSGPRPASPVGEPDDSGGIERAAVEETTLDDVRNELSEPYREADFKFKSKQELHLVPLDQLSKFLVLIVEIEGPVHEEEVARRAAAISGRGRVGRRIAQAVDAGLNRAVTVGLLVREGPFVSLANDDPVPVRNREHVNSAYLRKSEYLPPAEIRSACDAVIRTHTGVTRDEIITEVARMLGFKVTSSQLRELLGSAFDRFVGESAVVDRDGRYYAGSQ